MFQLSSNITALKKLPQNLAVKNDHFITLMILGARNSSRAEQKQRVSDPHIWDHRWDDLNGWRGLGCLNRSYLSGTSVLLQWCFAMAGLSDMVPSLTHMADSSLMWMFAGKLTAAINQCLHGSSPSGLGLSQHVGRILRVSIPRENSKKHRQKLQRFLWPSLRSPAQIQEAERKRLHLWIREETDDGHFGNKLSHTAPLVPTRPSHMQITLTLS